MLSLNLVAKVKAVRHAHTIRQVTSAPFPKLLLLNLLSLHFDHFIIKMDIKPTDLISGAQYLKFLSAYKKHDEMQKNQISQLEYSNEILQWENQMLQSYLDEYESGLTTKNVTRMKRQAEEIHNLQTKICELKREIQALKKRLEK